MHMEAVFMVAVFAAAWIMEKTHDAYWALTAFFAILIGLGAGVVLFVAMHSKKPAT